MLNILFIHQNFPGQFRHLAPALVALGHRVKALCMRNAVGQVPMPGVDVRIYPLRRKPLADQHPLLREQEAKVLRGESCAAAMQVLAGEGFVPDVVITNPAWGEALFVKDVFPRTKLICLMEFFYGTPDADVGFDPEFSTHDVGERLRQRLKNMALTQALLDMDQAVAPTAWQASRLPAGLRQEVEVVFDGIDTEALRPNPHAEFQCPASALAPAQRLRAGDPVVTFVNRNLEPYRGYHRFMRALPALLRAVPQAQVVVVGGEGVSYGAAAPKGQTWKAIFLKELADALAPDEQHLLARLHFVGYLPWADHVRLLQVSAAHVYLTYPFVLSWSCLEAMSVGAHLIASRTTPVQEFVQDGVNGDLVDFFDTEALSLAMIRVLQQRGQPADVALRTAARQTAQDRCDLRRVCLPRWLKVLENTLAKAV